MRSQVEDEWACSTQPMLGQGFSKVTTYKSALPISLFPKHCTVAARTGLTVLGKLQPENR